KTEAGENINFIVPQRIRKDRTEKTTLFMRVKQPQKNGILTCKSNGEKLLSKKLKAAAPPEMIACEVIPKPGETLTVDVTGGLYND
ncbi:MAG: pyridine nucleotide-disulfide oxidoreductase, partial [Eubacterium sp.]